MRDRLVDADLAAELLARRGVLDPELERLRRDPDGLECERGELLVLGPRVVEQRLADVRAAAFLVQHRAVEERELGAGDLVSRPAAVAERLARLAPEQLLLLGERELHISV